MLIRGSLLFGMVYLASMAAILLLIKQPESSLLRVVVLALPVFAASIVVVEWYEATASRVLPLPEQVSSPSVIGTIPERAA